MRRTEPVAPFLGAASGSVSPELWRLAGGGDLESQVEHWDPDLVLSLERRVAVDVDLLLSSTGSADPAEIAVAAVWRSSRTRLKGPAMSVSLADAGKEGVLTLGAEVTGAVAGGRLELQTVVMRTAIGARPTPFTAYRTGSVLWSDRVPLALEGEAARFPVSVVDFEELVGVDSDAAWTLQWAPRNLDQAVLGEMRLLVNSRNRLAVTAVEEGAAGLEAAAVASMIRFDVTRTLVHGALTNREFVENPEGFEADSVGRMLFELLGRLWPGAEPTGLAARLAATPHRLESELQARTGLLAP